MPNRAPSRWPDTHSEPDQSDEEVDMNTWIVTRQVADRQQDLRRLVPGGRRPKPSR